MKTIKTVQAWKNFLKTKRVVGQIWKVDFGKPEWQVQMPKGFETFGTLKEARKFSLEFLKTL